MRAYSKSYITKLDKNMRMGIFPVRGLTKTLGRLAMTGGQGALSVLTRLSERIESNLAGNPNVVYEETVNPYKLIGHAEDHKAPNPIPQYDLVLTREEDAKEIRITWFRPTASLTLEDDKQWIMQGVRQIFAEKRNDEFNGKLKQLRVGMMKVQVDSNGGLNPQMFGRTNTHEQNTTFSLRNRHFETECMKFLRKYFDENDSERYMSMKATMVIHKMLVRDVLQGSSEIDLRAHLSTFLRKNKTGESEELKELLRKFIILTPHSYKNCLVKAVILHNQVLAGQPIGKMLVQVPQKDRGTRCDLDNLASKFVTRHKLNVEAEYQEFVSTLITKQLVSGIVVHILFAASMETETYGEVDSKIMHVLKVGNHAMLLVPRATQDKLAIGPDEMHNVFDFMRADDKAKLMMPADIISKRTSEALDLEHAQKYTLLTFDIETINEDGKRKTYLIGMCDSEFRYTKFDEFIDFMDELVSHNYTTKQVFAFAHNCKFDSAEMWNYGLRDLQLKQRNGKFYAMSFTSSDGNSVINVVDSMTYSPLDLMTLTSGNKVHKKCPEILMYGGYEIGIAQVTEKHLRDPAFMALLVKYNEEDCTSLMEWLKSYSEAWIKNFEIDPIPVSRTSAGIARALFFSKYYKNDIWTLPYEVSERISREYYGGRVECFDHLGQWGHITYIDINSLYPTMMQKHVMPVRYLRSFKGNLDALKKFYGFCRCKVRSVDKECKPLIGVLRDGKLLFPVMDNFTEVYVYSETLKVALSTHNKTSKPFYEVDPTCIIEYDEFEAKDVFTEFIKTIYKTRQAAKMADNKLKREKKDPENAFTIQACKDCMNSLYGGFGIKPEFEVTEVLREKKFFYQLLLGSVTWFSKLEPMIQTTRPRRKAKPVAPMYACSHKEFKAAPFANIAIASAITSNARTFLWQKMMDIEDAGFSVAYCDTDSIMTTMPSKELKSRGLLDEFELGKFKVEFDDVTIITAGLKEYGIIDYEDHGKKKSKAVLKGFKGVRKLDSDTVKDIMNRLMNREKVPQTNTQFHLSTKEVLNEHGVKVTSLTREIQMIYDKGDLGRDLVIKPKHI